MHEEVVNMGSPAVQVYSSTNLLRASLKISGSTTKTQRETNKGHLVGVLWIYCTVDHNK